MLGKFEMNCQRNYATESISGNVVTEMSKFGAYVNAWVAVLTLSIAVSVQYLYLVYRTKNKCISHGVFETMSGRVDTAEPGGSP